MTDQQGMPCKERCKQSSKIVNRLLSLPTKRIATAQQAKPISQLKTNLEKSNYVFLFVLLVAFRAAIIVLEVLLDAGFTKHMPANSDARLPMFILVVNVYANFTSWQEIFDKFFQ